MVTFSLNDILIQEINFSHRENEIQPDFYYALFPLIINIEDNLNKLFFLDYDCSNLILSEKREGFIRNLAGQINFYIKEKLLAYSLIHELEIAKEAEILEGDDSNERFSFFIKEITTNPEWISYYFEKYPILFNRLNTQIKNILIHIEELIVRTKVDIKDLESLYDRDIFSLNSIQLFLGDMHKNGRTVSFVTFNNGFKIVYKPRSLENENSFQKFINFLNTSGSDINIGFPKILTREEYGWMEFIEYNEVANLKEIESHYHNIGKILCVFYLLGTHDIMPDNIILRGNKPFFIDLECLLNKPIKSGYSKNIISNIFQSVLSVGILPFWAQGNDMERDLVRSVLYGANQQKIKSVVWKNKNTDKMEQEVNEVFAGNGSIETHLPSFEGTQYNLNYNYYLKLREGFIEQYKFFQNNKDSVLERINSDVFKNTFIRFIIHNTSVYDLLLRDSIIPECLQGDENIESIINRLFEVVKKPLSKKLAKSIKEQINVGDIPYFYTYNEINTSLYASNSDIISQNYFDKIYTGTYMAIERLKNLSQQDLNFQLNIIDISCKYSFEIFKIDCPKEINFITPEKWKNSISETSNNFNKNELLEIADKIGCSLTTKVYYNKYSKEYNWVWKSRDVDGRWGCLPLNLDLYDGLSGMCYFYLYLHKYTQNKEYLHIAETTFLRMKETFIKMEKHFLQLPIELIATQSISPFSFPFSVVFLMNHFSNVLEKNYWDDRVIDLFFRILDRYLIFTKNTDFLLGQSGLLQLLISLPNQENEIIDRFIKKSISNIYNLSVIQKDDSLALPYIDSYDLNKNQLFLGGFAHGSSGISASILRYAALKNDFVAETLGLKILEHDRSQFITEIKGWRDGREGLDKYDAGCWCHGSAGIALSRLMISDKYSDNIINSELLIAKENIIKTGIGGNQSLCHGDLGNLEILRAIGTHFNDNEIKYFVQNYLSTLILKFKNGEAFKTGEDGLIPLVNLFMGEAGIGYGFLRQYDWENVPCVLALESSQNEFINLHKE